MPHIQSNQTASAIFAGFVDLGWLGQVAPHVLKWLKKPTFNLGDFGHKAVDFLVDTAVLGVKGVKAVVLKGDFGKIFNYFAKNPVKAAGAALTLAAGAAAVVGIGCVLISGAITIGGLIGGALGLSGFVGTLSGLGILGGLVSGLNYLLGNPIAACIQWVVSGVLFLYDFDFNISDEDLDKQTEQNLTNVFGSLGTVAGYAIADVTCGFLPSVGLIKLNLTTAHKCWEIIGEQDKQEFVSGLASLLGATTNYTNAILFAKVFKNIRKVVQSWTQNPYAKKLLEAVHPGFSSTIEELGKTKPDTRGLVGGAVAFGLGDAPKPAPLKIRKEPFIIREKIETKIQKIKDPNQKAFVSNLYNAAFQSCTNQLLCLSFVV